MPKDDTLRCNMLHDLVVDTCTYDPVLEKDTWSYGISRFILLLHR
jgi:hypothetical protein